MRQPQQKHRGRGRGRKPQNPLSRNFESNGPEVRIRGNAGHVAEKYTTLARDALSNGDTVTAENYFQHAEHYNRIVAAAQSQNSNRGEDGQQNERNENNQSVNGRGPQPQVDGAAGEAVRGEETSQAIQTGEAVKEETKQAATEAPVAQKSRRRTSRQAPPADVEASSTSKEEPGEQDAPAKVEGISKDAANLPGSITGGSAVEENS